MTIKTAAAKGFKKFRIGGSLSKLCVIFNSYVNQNI
jgi:hypothetical protein